MPIMAVQDQNDARGIARVLADTTRQCVLDHSQASSHRIALNNFFRLLRAYKTHRFTGYHYEPRSPRGPESLSLMNPQMDRHVVDMTMALDKAFLEAYKDEPEDQAIASIESVLRSVASSRTAPEPQEQKRATVFLDSFISNLYGQT